MFPLREDMLFFEKWTRSFELGSVLSTKRAAMTSHGGSLRHGHLWTGMQPGDKLGIAPIAHKGERLSSHQYTSAVDVPAMPRQTLR
jgi:hypothetical protein